MPDLLTFEQGHGVVLRDLAVEVVKLVKQEFHDVTATFVVDSAHNVVNEVEAFAPDQHIAKVEVTH